MHGHREVYRVYRALLSAGRSYPDYNVRNYIMRRVRQEFRKNANLAGPALSLAFADVRFVSYPPLVPLP